MIDRKAFGKGLLRIATAVRQPLDEATIAVYIDALGRKTEAQEWEGFSKAAVEAGRWEWFPKLRELQDALAEFRGGERIDVEAVHAYERVLDSGTYSPESGSTWVYRTIAERCGRAAAEAFIAAGGHSAFVTTWDEAKRRERFIAAYVSEARAVPEHRMLAAAPQVERLRLVGNAGPPVSHDTQILRKIADMTPEQSPHERDEAERVNQQRFWDVRLRTMKQQADYLGIKPEDIEAAKKAAEEQ